MKTVCIIGGGPAGMMAAISTKLNNPSFQVHLIERNKMLGQKLRLTGGGRCNVTANVTNEEVIASVVKNGRFLYSTLSNFNPQSIIEFFNQNGCPLKMEDHFRMFPVTDNAVDIIAALNRKINELKIDLHLNTYVTNLDFVSKQLITSDKTYTFDYLVLATGGITLPQSGSDGNMHEHLKAFDQPITELKPAEVPLVSNERFIQEKILQGLSFKDVKMTVYNENGKAIRTLTHDLLITHFGLSGPAALRLSFDIIELLEKQKDVLVSIDFIPRVNLPMEAKSMDYKDILQNENVPKRLIDYIKEDVLTSYEILSKLKNFTMKIHDTRGFKSAFVTNGGIHLKYVDPKTMKSKIYPFLSFAGELLDINAYTGGFNITSALSTGYTAGLYIDNE